MRQLAAFLDMHPCLPVLALCLMVRPAAACETALMLAVDVSGSITGDEYVMQMNGLADALLDPDVMAALVDGQDRLALMHWSGLRKQRLSLGWQILRTQQDVAALAATIRTIKRPKDHTDTAIGAALFVALSQFPVPGCARQVIDLSGDGAENSGTYLPAARAEVIARGIMLNGIAIENGLGSSHITEYFWNELVTPNGFVITADSVEDYPRAIRIKLLRELVKPVS
jgi:Ca-activated chloride channel family protein